MQQALLLALGNTEWRYHCVNQFERGLGLVAENHHPFVEFFLVVIADDVGLRGKFHLTQMHHLINARNDEVDLCAFVFHLPVFVFFWPNAPRRYRGGNARNAQSFLDGVEVFEANHLESKTFPSLDAAGHKVVHPKIRVGFGLALHKFQVKQAERVGEFVMQIPLALAKRNV